MGIPTWHWGTADRQVTPRELPTERLVVYCQPNDTTRLYWAAYKKGRQVNGGWVSGDLNITSPRGFQWVHTLQVVLGYGTLYWRHGDDYYKVDLFLIEHNDEKLARQENVTSYDFDPTDV